MWLSRKPIFYAIFFIYLKMYVSVKDHRKTRFTNSFIFVLFFFSPQDCRNFKNSLHLCYFGHNNNDCRKFLLLIKLEWWDEVKRREKNMQNLNKRLIIMTDVQYGPIVIRCGNEEFKCPKIVFNKMRWERWNHSAKNRTLNRNQDFFLLSQQNS